MNEHLFVNNHGLRLITQFEGNPRLNARLCEGGRYELGYGVTFHIDGRPVEQGEACTEDYALAMFRNALQHFEEVVRRHVTVELNSNQFSSLVALTYNIGEANFATGPYGHCTVLRETNARRFADAAAAFGMWVFATKNGYKQALRGLLRRHYAEACLFMGYDWIEATADEAIALQRIKPDGDPPKGTDRVTYKTPFVEVLRVAQQYPLDTPQIVADAQPPVLAPTVLEPVQYIPAATADTPLDRQGIPIQLPIPREDELLLDQPAAPPKKADAKGSPSVHPQPVPAAVPSEFKSDPQPSNSKGQMSKPPTGEVAAAPSPRSEVTPLPPPKLPDPPVPIGQQTGAVDATRKGEEWSKNAKSMVFSRRFWGLFLVLIGRLWMLKTGSNAVLGTVSDPLVMEMFSGFMVMILGELVQHWGGRKATRPLK